MADEAERAFELEQVMSQVYRRLGREMTQCLDGGLTPAQFFVLRLLKQRGRATVSEVAEWLGVTRSAITGMADRLKEAELIDRDRDAADRRVVWLVLTARGEDRLVEVEGRWLERLRLRLARLAPGEQRQLAELLLKLGFSRDGSDAGG